jgi:hypothetical protein
MVANGRRARRWSAYAALGIVALALCCIGASDRNPNHPRTQQQAQAEKTRAPPAGANPATAPDHGGASESGAPRDDSSPPEDWFGLSSESLSARSSAILAVLTAMLGIGTVALAFYTRRLVIDGARNLHAARVSARIAHRSLAHARESAVSMRESEERLERAYVFIGISAAHFTPYGYRVIVGVNNVGKTPAFLKRLSAEYFSGSEPAGPGGSVRGVHYPMDYVWAAGQAEDVHNSPFDVILPRTYLGFTATYTDIFGRQHFSRFLAGFDGDAELVRFCPTNLYWNEWD